MSVQAAQLIGKVEIQGDEEAKRKLGSVSDKVDKVSGGFKSMLGGALSFAGGLGVFNLAGDAISLVKDQISGMFEESMNAQAGMALTNAVLKSTHDASGETAQGIADLATQYSHLTKFSDDTVQSGENMLLTFTNIGKDVFPQATKTVLDMSQALGQDTKSSAIQLGKALNDPITGVTALQRVGVTFNQTQKDLIKGYVDHGQIAKAQGVILKELQKEFGGTAEAAGKTFGGQLAIAGQYMDDFKQNLGDDLMPIVTQFLGMIEKDGMPLLQSFSDWFTKEATPALQELSDQVGPLVSNVEDFAGSLFDTVNKSGALQSVLQTIRDVLPDVRDFLEHTATTIEEDLLPPVLSLVKNFSTWLDKSGILRDALGFLDGAVSMVATDAGWFVQELSDLFGWLDQNKGASDAVKLAIEGIGGAILALKIADMGKNFYTTIAGMGKNVTDFVGTLGTIKDKAGEVLNFFTGRFKGDSEAALSDVGTTAKGAGSDVATIGKSAEISAGEVQGAAVTEERALGGVNAEAKATDESLLAQGPAATAGGAEAKAGLAPLIGSLGTIGGLLAGITGNVMTFGAVQGTNPIKDLQSGNFGGALGWLVSVGTPGGVLAEMINQLGTINQLIHDITGSGSGSGGGSPAVTFTHVPGARGYASGVTNAPAGWATVGERGPELMYVPQGASIFPNSQTMLPPMGQQTIVVQPPDVILDGIRLSRALLPHLNSALRNGTGRMPHR